MEKPEAGDFCAGGREFGETEDGYEEARDVVNGGGDRFGVRDGVCCGAGFGGGRGGGGRVRGVREGDGIYARDGVGRHDGL